MPPGCNSAWCRYVGEVIDSEMWEERKQQLGRFDHMYFMALNHTEIVDATRKGNIARFINHSCSPNLIVEKWCASAPRAVHRGGYPHHGRTPTSQVALICSPRRPGSSTACRASGSSPSRISRPAPRSLTTIWSSGRATRKWRSAATVRRRIARATSAPPHQATADRQSGLEFIAVASNVGRQR